MVDFYESVRQSIGRKRVMNIVGANELLLRIVVVVLKIVIGNSKAPERALEKRRTEV